MLLRPRGLGGSGLAAECFVGFWWCLVLWVAPWVGCRLDSGFVDGGGCGLVVVRGWVWVWVWFVGFSGVVWFAGVGDFGFGLGLGF